MNEISFMGHRITPDGLQPDPDKIKAIVDMEVPQNVEQLRRFIDIVNYLGRFLSNLTTAAQPLHNLTKHNVHWTWSEAQANSFNEVKKLVTSAPALAYYDADQPLFLENDASEYGIGSTLLQNGRPIAFTSRVLTDTECRYAQIEKAIMD